jgi:hypothetical protein
MTQASSLHRPVTIWQRLRFAWRKYLEPQPLQYLDGGVGGTIQDYATAGECGGLPLASLAAEAEHAVLEGTIEKELAVESNRFRPENLVLNLFHQVPTSFRMLGPRP